MIRDRLFHAKWLAARERFDLTRAAYLAAIEAVSDDRIDDALELCEGALMRLLAVATRNGGTLGFDERAMDQALALSALLAEAPQSDESAMMYGSRARELLKLAARLRVAVVVGHNFEACA